MPGLRRVFALGLLLMSAGPAAAEDGLARAARIADDAIAHGYGTACDLSAKPVTANGYFLCVDIPPYRFVRTYSGGNWRLDGYLVAGGDPFRFMEAAGGHVTVLVKGPWETDLPPRADKFADDNSGVSAERVRRAEPESRRMDAERRLQEFIDKDSPKNGQKGQPGDQK